MKNIIFILIDGARFDIISNSQYKDFFSKALWYNRVYAVSPYTIGSMHSIFTSLYPKNNGVNGYFNPKKLKENVKIIPQYLKDKGYYTICNIPSPVVMANRGFDIYDLHDEYNEDVSEKHFSFVKNNAENLRNKKPFFLYLHYSKIHTDLVNNVLNKYDDFSEEYFEKYDENKKRYEQSIYKSYEYIQGIMKIFENEKLMENTDIWILSDHGSSLGEKIGERAYGVYLYDYTLHTFLIKYNSQMKEYQEDNKIRATIDILPLIFQSANINIPENIDGRENRYIEKKKLFMKYIDYEPLFLETGGVDGPFPSPEKHNVFGIIKENKKLIHYKSIDKFEMFEISPIGEKQIEIDKYMRKLLLEYEI